MPKLLQHIFAGAAAVFLSVIVTSCNDLDDERIPYRHVEIVFNNQADWDIYGTPAALDYQYFIRELRRPANFPFLASTYTGFGGVLLVCDVMGAPKAFDLSCPVERVDSIRVRIMPDDAFNAECPKCHSKYNVISLDGYPVSGEAAKRGYGLRRYHVGPRANSFMVISN